MSMPALESEIEGSVQAVDPEGAAERALAARKRRAVKHTPRS
jgi:hypothetical protein